MNLIFKKNNIEISNLTQWKELGHPKSSNQWKKGRSSCEMGTYAIEHTDKFKEHIETVLTEFNIPTQDFECEPEAYAGLGNGMKTGAPRNHDLLMIGNDCIIGVEAKVSEGFDKSLISNIESQAKKKENIEDTRGYQLYKYLMPDTQLEQIQEIGFQLFTATRAVINDAYKHKKNNAILLVIVFTGDIDRGGSDYEEKCNKNDEDFELFKKALRSENDKIVRSIDGKCINCYIKKVKVHLPDYTLEK